MALVTASVEVSGTKCIYFVPLYIPQVYVPASELGLPHPLTRRRVSPPLIPCRGAHSLAGEGVGGSQFRRGDVRCGTLYVYMYSVLPSHSLLSPSAIKVNGSLSAIRPYTRVKTKHVSSFLQKALATVVVE